MNMGAGKFQKDNSSGNRDEPVYSNILNSKLDNLFGPNHNTRISCKFPSPGGRRGRSVSDCAGEENSRGTRKLAGRPVEPKR